MPIMEFKIERAARLYEGATSLGRVFLVAYSDEDGEQEGGCLFLPSQGRFIRLFDCEAALVEFLKGEGFDPSPQKTAKTNNL
jgi:hypothetical protein